MLPMLRRTSSREMSRLTALTASSGLPPSSFFSWIARLIASFSLDPMAAASPVSGPNTPILTVSAAEAWTAAAMIKAAMQATLTLRKRIVHLLCFGGNSRIGGMSRTIVGDIELPILFSEIARPDLWFFEKALARIGQHDRAGLDHITARRERQRQLGILLDQKNG